MTSDQLLAPLVHGGDLGAAEKLFPDAPRPFVDLSTGINPRSYPLPALAPEDFARLPDPAALARLAAVAAAAYGAPSAAHVVPAPGTQILLPQIARLIAPGRAAVLGPSYGELLRAAALAGHAVTQVAEIAALAGADLAVLCNPNNPDGRFWSRQELRSLAAALRPGLLLVDEAFMEVGPPGESLAPAVEQNIVVLRSFGKFFGLAGLRLGFALAAPPLAARLRATLGPWAVSGPALAVGQAALADTPWIARTRMGLEAAARRLDALLAAADLQVIGGTALFRLVRTSAAAELFARLGHAGIVVRRFADQPSWLRFGLPDDEPQWDRLQRALLIASA